MSNNTDKKYQIVKKEELFFDWKDLSKKFKNNEAELEKFIQESKSQIASMLIEATKIRRIVPELLRKTSSQSSLSQIVYNEDEIWGEVRLVICHVLQRWETICRISLSSKKKVKHATNGTELRMNTESDIIGYFRNALQNSFADLFIKHNAQKRAASETTFSGMNLENNEDKERTFEDTLACSRSNELILNTYKRDMINYLRNYDRKNNTRTARLFVAMMNPRHNGAITTIQSKLKINNKNFNETKDLLIKLIGEEFADVSREVLNYMNEKRGFFEDLEVENKISRKYKNRKKQKALDNKKPLPCRMNVIYGQRLNPDNKWTYYATVTVDRSKTPKIVAYMPENWENIFKHEETIVCKSNQMEKIRPKLEKVIKKQLLVAKKLVESSSTSIQEQEAV